MKKIISVGLSLLLCCQLGIALAATNVLRQDDAFQMQFDDLNTTESHVLALEAGTALYVSSTVTSGTLSILIKQDGGETIYNSTENTAPGFSVDIHETGHYRVVVTGEHAAGSVWISMYATSTASAPVQSNILVQRQLIQSKLGYVADCDIALLDYTADETIGIDRFAAREEPALAALTIARAPGGFESAVQSAREAFPDAEQLPPSVLNFRAAHSFRSEADGTITTITVVEIDESESFVITQHVPAGMEEVAAAMQNMVSTIQFTY